MKGIEMMLANLLGIKPEEMRAQIEQALTLMKTGANAAEQVQRDLAAIKKHLGIEEETQNVGNAIAERRNSSANGNHIQL